MALPPCHLLYQFNVCGDFLDLKMYQRSADWFLGVPFNIASYALLLRMVCHLTGKKARMLILTFGDAHVYKTHVDQIKEQTSREPYPFPTLDIVDRGQEQVNLEDFKFEDFKLLDYKCHPTIKAEMAV
jgi:thymidylate synthase